MEQNRKPQTGKIAVIDPTLLDDLKAFKAAEHLTSAALARRIGVSETYVSRAFSGNFTGDADEFETKARAALKAAEAAKRAPLVKIATRGFLVEPMRQFLSTVQHTCDIGIAWSDAGKGKTCGIEVYRQNEPLSVIVTASKELCGWRALRGAIIAQMPSVKLKRGESYGEYLQRIFRGSERLLIIDNAHLLTESARHWLCYDWHEKTGCGVALVGNEAIEPAWQKIDQHSSRVGLAYEVRPAADVRARDTAKQSFDLLLPDFADDATLDLAAEVIKSKGAARALRKHVNLCRELRQSKDFASKAPAAIFRAANRLLLGNAKLGEAA